MPQVRTCVKGITPKLFEKTKAESLSIIAYELKQDNDEFLNRLKTEIENLNSISTNDMIEYMKPKGQFFSRDAIAVTQGRRAPPHLTALAEVYALEHNVGLCSKGADLIAQAASYLERQRRRFRKNTPAGTKIFIGHGRATDWRELKDFIQDRIALPWDEFNRVSVAGVPNVVRLSEMLDSAAIAFLIMTGEDEIVDGGTQARMNVIHEAGLFQGRLGFSKAIVLLEDGCSEFSNIQGLGQIHFPKGRISSIFEEVRQVLEREGLI